MFFIPTLAFLDSAIDFITISCIAALVLLSLFSICFIFHLHFKSRSSRHLQNFNSLWTIRFLFVFFIAFWAFTELLRLPLFRRIYLYPFLPKLTVQQQANFCKAHLVLSLGFFEPGFLITLLFLLDFSAMKINPHSFLSAFFVLASSLPISLLQVYVVFFQDSVIRFPDVFQRSWFLPSYSKKDPMVLCTYPLLSTILFGFFGTLFSFSFLFSFWRVASHVINKALRLRILALAFTVVVTLPLQILFMALSVFWKPDNTAFEGLGLLILLCTLTCAAVGEGILVIKPIADSLAADIRGGRRGDNTCEGSRQGERTTSSTSLRPLENGNYV